MFKTEPLCAAIKQHAIAAWPRESCGVVTPDGYVPLENVAENPVEAFDCCKQLDPYIIQGTALALVHSHPTPEGYKPEPWPSADDIRNQWEMDIPWGLLTSKQGEASTPFFWGDSLGHPPLEKRQFRHGPSGTDGRGDCYALIRDFYKEAGIELPPCPRDWRWWESETLDGANLYEDGFAGAGFVTIDKCDVHEGDVGLVCIPSASTVGRPVPLRPCHGVIYVGRGQVLHHKVGRLSVREPLGSWNTMVKRWVRHAAYAA